MARCRCASAAASSPGSCVSRWPTKVPGGPPRRSSSAGSNGSRQSTWSTCGLHRRRAARPPRPDARADIVDDRDGRVGRPHLACDAQAEIRAVDGDQAIWLLRHDRARGLADAPHQARQVADDGAETPSARSRRHRTGGFSPSACKWWPPTPTSSTRGRSLAVERATRSAPSRSPDSSPATMAIFSGRRRAHAPSLLQADDEQAERVGVAQHRLMVEDQRAAGLDADAGQPGGMRGVDRQRPDRRHVGAQFLTRLGAFDQDAALLAGQPAMRAQHPSPARAGRRFLRRPPARWRGRRWRRRPGRYRARRWPCAAANAASMSRRSAAVARPCVIDAFAASRSGTISCAPTTFMPRSSMARRGCFSSAVVALAER